MGKDDELRYKEEISARVKRQGKDLSIIVTKKKMA